MTNTSISATLLEGLIVLVAVFMNCSSSAYGRSPSTYPQENDIWIENHVIFKPLSASNALVLKNMLDLDGNKRISEEFHMLKSEEIAGGKAPLNPYDFYLIKSDWPHCDLCSFILAQRDPRDTNKWLKKTFVMPADVTRISPEQRCHDDYVVLIYFGKDRQGDKNLAALTDNGPLLGPVVSRKCNNRK